MTKQEAIRCADAGAEYWYSPHVVLRSRWPPHEYYSVSIGHVINPTTGTVLTKDQIVYRTDGEKT